MFKKDKNNPRRSNVYLLMFCSVLSKFLKKVEGPTIGGRNLVAALCTFTLGNQLVMPEYLFLEIQCTPTH